LRGHVAEFKEGYLKSSLYRPFSKQWYFADPMFNEDLYLLEQFFPRELKNSAILVNLTAERPFTTISSNEIPNLVCAGGFGSSTQTFPFAYVVDGETRENITDWSLHQFRSHYKDKNITKWDVFHYVYGVLHDPDYRTRYAANLKRELPRIPCAPDFWAYAKAGKRLMELHVDYEKQNRIS
jgi:predicted helicase